MDSKASAAKGDVYDAFRRGCPSHTVLEVLTNKWAHLVICSLRDEKHRFGELQRRLEGVTPKMLTQTLRTLERDGLVKREIFPVIPPRVEYELTDLGLELVSLLDAVLRWSERHVPEILKAREMFGRQRVAKESSREKRRL